MFLSARETEVQSPVRIPSILDRALGVDRDGLYFPTSTCLRPRVAVSSKLNAVRSNPILYWSAYPALLVACAFGVGVAVGSVTAAVWPGWWIGGVGIGFCVFAVAEWRDRTRIVSLAPLGRMIGVLLVGVSAGGVCHAVYMTPSPRSVGTVADASPSSPVTLSGEVEDAPEQSETATRFTLDVDSIHTARVARAADGRVRVTIRPSPWDHVSAKRFPTLFQGDRVRLQGSLRVPPGKRNPGGFDYAAYLARRGICCTMYVDIPGAVDRLAPSASLITRFVVSGRQYVRRQITRYVPSADGRAVLQALLLGDRSGISDTQREWFVQTGLMHLLAVSGLHVFLVGMVLYVLLRPLLMRLRLGWKTVELARSVLTVVALSLYVGLTGARPSVVRAVVMSTFFIGGLLFQRSAHPLNTLGIAALLLLSVRPPALFDVGFQLSMAAVAGIVTIHPQIVDNLPELWTASPVGRWLLSTVSVSAAATVATAPVLLFHFGWVSAAGLFLNVLGIPCTALALSSALALVGVGGVWPMAGVAFGSSADIFVDGLLLASREGAMWLGWFGVRIFDLEGWVLGALILGVFSFVQWSRSRYRWRCLIAACLFATAGVWIGAIHRSAAPTLDVLFFDVGQGDAALVTTPEDRRILIDTGPRSFSGDPAVSYSLLPYLEQRGVDHLDAVIVTHPDADHLGGLPGILRSVSVGRVYHNGQHADTELYRRTRRLLRTKKIPIQSLVRGDTIALGASVRGEVLGPPPHPSQHGIETENGASVVLRLSYGTVDILLPGDIEAQTEANLLRTYGQQLESRVVKVPHHGSKTSSTVRFVQSVAEKKTMAVVSVGASNRFGMPSSRVLSRWESVGNDVWSTARHGAVWFRTDGEEVWAVQWR